MADDDTPTPLEARDETDGILQVHLGRSANCSSIGSVVDYLFLSGLASASLLTLVAAHLGERRDDHEGDASVGEATEERDEDA